MLNLINKFNTHNTGYYQNITAEDVGRVPPDLRPIPVVPYLLSKTFSGGKRKTRKSLKRYKRKYKKTCRKYKSKRY